MTRSRSAFLLLSVFLSGAAVMVVEMTAVRLLQPVFGSTTYVWTNVIAVVLAALSVGYAVGGRLADARPSPAIFYGLLACGGVLVVGSGMASMPISRWLLPAEGVNLEGIAGTLVKGSLVASLLLFAPPTMVLGAVSPMAIRLLSEAGVGRAAGRVFALSTVGSIVGTYLPTLWLVPELGSRNTIMVAAAMLVVPGVLGLLIHARGGGRATAAGALLLASALYARADTSSARGAPPLPDGGTATVHEELESPYQFLTVRDDHYPDGSTHRLLTINEGVYTYHSYRILGQILTGSRYYDDYALLPFLLDLEPGDALRGAVVGLAGGVTAHHWKHFWGDIYDLHVDGAEIDPDVVRLGREYFHLPEEGADWLDAWVMDGRQMLELLPRDRRHHMIVVDAFAHELYIPFHLATEEFFRLCHARLEPGGVLAMNIYAYRSNSPNLLAIENTLASVFGSCVRVRQSWGGNYVLLARNGQEPPDVARLALARIEERFGTRDVVEWDRLLELAQRVPPRSSRAEYDPAQILLTDDHSPLERLMDAMLARSEREAMGRSR